LNSPLVSVLIPTLNSSSTLEACIQSIKAQTYSNIEIIVIDNFSVDATNEIALSENIKLLQKGPERSAQLNFGASTAKGKYIFRVDSDMVADPEIIEKCVRLCFSGAEAVVVPVLPHPEVCNNYWVNCRLLEQKMLVDDMVDVAPRFLERSVFLGVGGYDERIVAWEDYDLHNRLIKAGCKLTCLQDSVLWHLGESSSLKEVVVRMIRYGKTGSLGLFTAKHGSAGLKQISLLRPSYIRHRQYLVDDPLHYFGMLFFKTVQVFSFLLGILSNR
jgi:glycosyltransferase involved in cell wall biosynthesis